MQRVQFASKNERDVKFEEETAKKKLKKDPEHVTTESSVRQFEPPGMQAPQASTSDGLVGDLVGFLCPLHFVRTFYLGQLMLTLFLL